MSAPERPEAIYAPLDGLLATGARRLRTARVRTALGAGLLVSAAWALGAAIAGHGLGVPGSPWVLVAPPALAGLAAFLSRRPSRARAAGALKIPSASLRSAILSAVELRPLAGASESSPSPALIAAHAAETSSRVGGVDVARALPTRSSSGILAAGVAFVLLDLILASAGPPGLGAGFHALVGAAAAVPRAAEREPITGDIELTYLYPSHTRLAPRTVTGTDGSIEAPVGTEVRLKTRADRDVASATAVVNGKATPLTVHDRRDLAGSILCRTAGSYFFRFLDGRGRVLAEGAPIPIALQADAPPQVLIEKPGTQLEVDPHSQVVIRYRADDDYGLSEIALLYRPPGAAKDRRTVLRQSPEGPRHVEAEVTFDLAPLELAPGDTVSYTIEALDNDAVAGPKAGRARTQTLKVYSAAEHHEEALRQARAVWEKLISLLADRIDEHGAPLGRPSSGAPSEADRRALALCDEMEGLARRLRKDTLTPPELPAALANVAQNERARASATLDAREMDGEGWRPSTRQGLAERLPAALAAEVEGLEHDVLYLEALLDRQTAEDLVNLAHELAARRRQLAELLEKYRTARTPELKAAIDAQLARLRERMQQLFARMAELTKSLSDEHLNAQAMAAMAQKDQVGSSLEKIQEDLARGDVDGALAALDQLGGTLDGFEADMRRASNEAEGQYPGLGRKVAALQRDLHAVGEGQRRVQSETQALRQRYRQALAQRAPITPQTIARLQAKVAAARDALAKIPENAMPPAALSFGGTGADPLAAAKEDVDQLGRALQARDLDEALRTSDRATVGAQAVAEDLSREARITRDYVVAPEDTRETAQLDAARGHAAAAVPPLEEVHDELSKLFPAEDSVLSAADKRRLGELAQEQSRLHKELHKVQDDLDDVQKTAPIFGPSAAQKLDQASSEMARAQDALGAHQPGQAVRREQGALQQLDGFEQAMKKGGGKGGGGGLPMPLAMGDGQDDGEEGPEGGGWTEQKVAIPGADQYRVPPEFRRDILDAMKQKPPPQYEDQVKQYYQEIVK
ncbi:MAG TPA: DUF4175 family protein [Myxococcales bacterium]|nr:DUF4175 family protein [Myxococcales bacterium]